MSNGAEYTFQLRAVNQRGGGAVSQATSTPATMSPQRPTGLTATPGGGQVLGSMSQEDPETTGKVIVSAARRGPIAPIICAGAQENAGGVGQALNHGAGEDAETINQALEPAENDRQCVNTLGGEVPVQTWMPEQPPQEGEDPSGEGEWQDIGSPIPVENILGRFRSAIAGAKTIVNNLTNRPDNAQPLPTGRIPYAYVRHWSGEFHQRRPGSRPRHPVGGADLAGIKPGPRMVHELQPLRPGHHELGPTQSKRLRENDEKV